MGGGVAMRWVAQCHVNGNQVTDEIFCSNAGLKQSKIPYFINVRQSVLALCCSYNILYVKSQNKITADTNTTADTLTFLLMDK